MNTSIVWFHTDLRQSDHVALSAAVQAVPWTPGAASDWWLHHRAQRIPPNVRWKLHTLAQR